MAAFFYGGYNFDEYNNEVNCRCFHHESSIQQ